MSHIPVLLKESIEILNPQSDENFIDCTFGDGGHSKEILKKISPNGSLLAIDWNKKAMEACLQIKKSYKNSQMHCENNNFTEIFKITKKISFPLADGLLLDLGISSDELGSSGRGFSFQKNEPLLMTFSDEQMPVKEIIKKLSSTELEYIIRSFGEEKFAKKIAITIKEELKRKSIETTQDLVEIIKRATPFSYHHQRIHPATRTFLALRIYANKELENLEGILKQTNNIVKIGGRIVVISFHSLEDRIVKNYFRQLKNMGLAEIITKKPITPSEEEIRTNPRSRSAKLRAVKLIKNE